MNAIVKIVREKNSQKVSLSSSQNWSHVMSYVNKALATPDLTESSAKNVVFVNFVQLPFSNEKKLPYFISQGTHDAGDET